jgi:hypothetical protein
MTPREFYCALEGYELVQEAETRSRAEFVAVICSVCGPADKHGRRKNYRGDQIYKGRRKLPRNQLYYRLLRLPIP